MTRFLFKAKTLPWALAFGRAAEELRERGVQASVVWGGMGLFGHDYPSYSGEIEEPDESEYPALDALFASQWAKSSIEEHGLQLPDHVLEGPHGFHRLARAIVAEKLGLDYQPGYFLPKAPRIPAPGGYNAVALSPESVGFCRIFLEGYGLEPNIADASGWSEQEKLEAIWRWRIKAVGLPISDRQMLTLRASYQGIDDMPNSPVALCYVGSEEPDPRCAVSFGSQIFLEAGLDPNEVLKRAGEVWKIRDQYGHNHIQYLRALARQK